ncbi:hypothetical protein FD754_007634, partial [Muntiacus muntjak]
IVSWRGVYFIVTLFGGRFFGSIFTLDPFSPLLFVNPSWYCWINNCLVATRLTPPVALLEVMHLYSYFRLEKIYLKASLKCVPEFDMIYYFCDIGEPLQLFIFPEGTDLIENKKTLNFMKETAIPPCKSEPKVLVVKLFSYRTGPCSVLECMCSSICTLCPVIFYNHHHLCAVGENIWWTRGHQTLHGNPACYHFLDKQPRLSAKKNE